MKRDLSPRWACTAAAAAAVLVYLPILSGGVIGWDDTLVIYHNPHLRSLDWAGLKWMFTSVHYDNYAPLAWLLFACLYKAFGLAPAAYHAASVGVHALMAAAVCLLSIKLFAAAGADSGRPAPGAGVAGLFAALTFALHPMLAEAVCDAAYLIDIPACLLAVLAILAYLEWASSRRRGWLAASWALALCSGLWRWQGIGLPVILAVLNIYPLKRLPGDPGRWRSRESLRVWRELAPFALISCGILLAQSSAKASTGYHAVARPFEAALGAVFYLRHWLMPADFMPVYVLDGASNPLGWPAAQGAAFFVALTALLFVARRRWPAGLAAWTCFLVAVAPTLAATTPGPLFAHDRYVYLGAVGFAVLGGAAFLACGRAWTRERSATALAAAAGLLALIPVLAGLASREIENWREPEKLWRHVLSIDPASDFANFRLAEALLDKGDFYGAVYYLGQQRRVDPATGYRNVGLAYFERGETLLRQGRWEKAAAMYRRANELNPGQAGARRGLATALLGLGRHGEAIAQFEAALREEPRDPDTLNNFGIALASQGRLARAETQFRAALSAAPGREDIRTNLRRTLEDRRRDGSPTP